MMITKFFFSSRRRHTRSKRDWSSDVCSSDLLGVKAVIAKSFARIHRSNLINSGILPLVFKNKDDYDKINEFSTLKLENVIDSIKNDKYIICTIEDTGEKIELTFGGSEREKEVVINGGFLNYAKEHKLEA